MKDLIQKEHSLILLIAYIITVNLKSTATVIDGLTLSLLFGYVIFDKYLKFKTQPDIRAEVFAEFKKLQTLQNEKFKEVDQNLKEASAAINKVINLKSTNIGGSVKF